MVKRDVSLQQQLQKHFQSQREQDTASLPPSPGPDAAQPTSLNEQLQRQQLLRDEYKKNRQQARAMSSRHSEGSEESDDTESDTDLTDPLLGREPLTAEQVYAICCSAILWRLLFFLLA